ncbi:MAG TPA: ATP-binding protein [Gallionella sp.]|nr:ATP-binding protein [Gallionella sp.]
MMNLQVTLKRHISLKSQVSLRERLLVLALSTVFLVWLAATAFTYYDTREELDEVLDVYLEQAAMLLVVQASHDLDEIETEHAPQLHKYSRNVAFQVWEGGRQLRLHSANAPAQPLTAQDHGFSDSTVDGHRWRVFSTWDDYGKYHIHVAERTDVRDELARDISGNMLKPLWFSLPLLAVLLWVAVARGLRPLVKLGREVERRAPDNLAPLDAKTVPREVQPLIERLNRLFGRIDAFVQKERRFTADAAHELRTPVAAIKAQAQVARAATGDADRARALDNAIAGCDRATHLIEQLLTLARLDALGEGAVEPCQLRAIAAEEIAALAPAALGKGVQLELLEGNEAVVNGNPGLLRILLRNLIDNAVRHTPSGTAVQVGVAETHEAVRLSVSDNGPGIPEQERSRIFERFYRPVGTQASGSGLGLSIVKRVAEIHAATLQVDAAGNDRGLKVEVVFRASRSA